MKHMNIWHGGNIWIFDTDTAWKVSKYGVISGPYFSVFGMNTEIYSVRTRNNSLDTFHAVRLCYSSYETKSNNQITISYNQSIFELKMRSLNSVLRIFQNRISKIYSLPFN